jgi:hypothetical protein
VALHCWPQAPGLLEPAACQRSHCSHKLAPLMGDEREAERTVAFVEVYPVDETWQTAASSFGAEHMQPAHPPLTVTPAALPCTFSLYALSNTAPPTCIGSRTITPDRFVTLPPAALTLLCRSGSRDLAAAYSKTGKQVQPQTRAGTSKCCVATCQPNIASLSRALAGFLLGGAVPCHRSRSGFSLALRRGGRGGG